MPLKPVESKKVYLRVVEQIRDMIQGGELGPGDQLPTTQELAETLRVSRPSVREALAALEILGLVESKPGSGCFVSRRRPTQDARHEINRMAPAWATADEILEARLAYEPHCAHLAAERRTTRDLEEMRCSPELQMVDIERVADGLPARFSDCRTSPTWPPVDFSLSFHAAIAVATRNPLLAAFGDAVSQAVRSPTWQALMRQIYLSPRNTTVITRQYEALYDAIEGGDTHLAETLMREHLLSLTARLND